MKALKTKSDRLDAARREKRLSYAAMAKAIDISPDGVRKMIERDSVRDLYLNIFEEKFGISRNWVETGEGEMFVSSRVSEPVAAYGDVLSVLQSHKAQIPEFERIFSEVSAMKRDLEQTKNKLITALQKYNELLEIIREAGYKI